MPSGEGLSCINDQFSNKAGLNNTRYGMAKEAMKVTSRRSSDNSLAIT
jgi:hypothetical protein